MTGFLIVWIGQFVSLMGSNMTGFAMTIWAYKLTGSATALALVGVFYMTPFLAISPVAGALVDRSNRKLMMMLSDLAAGLVTIGILILYSLGLLQIWHIYIASAIQGFFQSFQWPAYSAAVTTMLPKEQFGRANGIMSFVESGSGIFAPLVAGALLPLIGLAGILIIDIVTFVAAIGALLWVVVPQPQETEVGRQSKGSLLKESVFGFGYIVKRPSLLGLQLVFLAGNLFSGIANTVNAPMILSRSNFNELVFGSVNSIGAIGGVVGGLLMGVWGGPKRKSYGVLSGWLAVGLFSMLLMGLGRGLVIWAIASFISSLIVPYLNGSNQALWQAKVAPDVQGRVFSIRRLIAWISTPLSALIAGPLADYVLEPAMARGGSFASFFEPLVGSGAGTGMSLMYIFCGLGAVAVAVVAYFFKPVRLADTLMPDFDSPSPESAAAQAATLALETDAKDSAG